MLRPRRLHLKDLNPSLVCILCKGYLIDATTIIECLHSFCRSCIVQYLESNKYCPICDVQVHKTKPLLNIRPDQTLQDIVYKLVPGLFQNEMRRRREWFARDGNGTMPRPSEEGPMYLSLQYEGDTTDTDRRRFLRCPSAVSVHHLHKLLRAKYGLAQQHRVEVMYAGEPLRPDLTLADIAYIYLWRTKSPLHLTYRIFEAMRCAAKKESTISETTQQPVTETWKEVQLQISENGIMCVTNIEDALSPAVDQLNNNITQQDDKLKEKPVEPEKKEEVIQKEDKKEVSVENKVEKEQEKVEIVETEPEKVIKVEEKVEPPPKREAPEIESVIPAKQPRLDKEKSEKPSLKNVQQLSSNHPLKIHSQQISRPPPQPVLPPPNLQYSRVSIVPRRNIPPAYKTLRDPPRAWNPQLPPRPAPHGPQTTPTQPQTQPKPAKFFKARNNVPRYLGNPASGVKPMYQVPKTPPPGESIRNERDGLRTEREGSRIEREGPRNEREAPRNEREGPRMEREGPRTEREGPRMIGEGRPATPRPPQLKINQSTVPILNPLRDKVKSDRRPPNGKKEKPQISFTPPNPFVPQLGSASLPPPNHWAGGPPPVYFPPPGLFYQQRYAIQGPPRSPRPAPPPPSAATATSPDPKLAAA